MIACIPYRYKACISIDYRNFNDTFHAKKYIIINFNDIKLITFRKFLNILKYKIYSFDICFQYLITYTYICTIDLIIAHYIPWQDNICIKWKDIIQEREMEKDHISSNITTT